MSETTCRWVRRNLTAYADGELNTGDWSRVAVHLRRCPDCAARWEQQKSLEQMLDNLPLEIAPMELVDNIMTTVQPLAKERKASRAGEISWWDFGIKGLGLMLGNAVLVLAIWFTYLTLRYDWSYAHVMIPGQAALWRNTLLGRVEIWSTHLKGSAIQSWLTAINLPGESGGFLSRSLTWMGQLLRNHHEVLQYALLAVVLWVLLTPQIIYLGSKLIPKDGEERI